MFAQVGLQFCQILNKPSKDSQRVLKFCQSGEIFAKSGHTGSKRLFNPKHNKKLEVERGGKQKSNNSRVLEKQI